ncbi:hypothetical protein PR048_006333 [Dryococelus australis]|uniref:Uncharacterized protein n=1 Tax=Dryococelus australis TaxID=614101 RepID=A0ABQ9IAN5_9NEOP|nr:hypothetical protein PR048_006333 [Dryococelus australis]
MPGSKTALLCMDLQKIMFMPTLIHNSMFYSQHKEFFKSVEFKYLVSWHSSMDCECDYIVIEKRCKA